MLFVRNRTTNVLPILCGLFFKVEGTSSRVMKMLSNVGICISGRTVERLKEKVSQEVIQHGVNLLDAERLAAQIGDNINLYLRKYEQRMTNRNTMIHATNTALMFIDEEGVDVNRALNLQSKLDLRGQRSRANFIEDILPKAADDDHLSKSFSNIIAEFIIRYTPESNEWKGKGAMLKSTVVNMPQDRPLPIKKTKTLPFGVFDVNEGSKKGMVTLLDEIRKRARMTWQRWSGKVRIVLGDWLTSNNIRNARADRRDDVNPMERIEYIEEGSQMFHFALQGTVMDTKVHYGNPITDPTSLAAHKALLGRVWDVNKPNYAQAKSLMRHSAIGRILHIVL